MGKWTRRGFITAGVVGGTALVIGVAIRPGNQNKKLSPLVTKDAETLINTWVKIDENNIVTAIVPHSEMGQGAQTALTQMLADELDADWNKVQFMEAPAEDAYANYPMGKGYILGDKKIPQILEGSVDGIFQQVTKAMHLQITGGSASVRTTGVYGMRVAGAAARQMLLEAAAETWSVPIKELSVANSMISHTNSNRSAPFSEFATLAGTKSPSPTPVLKTPDQFTIMGKHKPRLDIPAKVDGTAKFGIDAIVDGMKYATINAAPVFGALVKSFDATKAKQMPGVIDVVKLDDAVAVVADGYWQAHQAMAQVKIEWQNTGKEKVSSESLFSQFQADISAAVKNKKVKMDVDTGDMSIFDAATSVVEREYKVPYLAHACMEPMNALARIENGQCDVWLGTQNPLGFKHDVADALGMDPDRVSITNHYMGGGFGRRSNSDVAVQAARIARAVNMPVKLIWSREEDMQHDHYRPAVLSRFRAALDAEGNPLGWQNHYVDKHEPIEAPLIPYSIATRQIGAVSSPTHVPFGPWRSVDHSQHGFFTESFTDELAFEAKQDPYQFRRQLLKDSPRHLAVLDLAAKKAGWDKPLAKGRGRGIALQQSFGSIVAEVVELTVNQGKVKVDKVTIAVDAGFAVSPNGLIAQMESGVIYGLTAALYGEITIEQGRVPQTNFDTYHMLRMDTAPEIETHIINSFESWGGAGEPGTPGIGPALTNAIFAATGTRIRELPISKYDLNVNFKEENDVTG